ncbi:MAG: hypothetical protein LN546_05970, partial [Rickettsia endosymbiont of Ecitomorpha arachnoides]|nr:hypothetical protein [Rickettsia endosymbiont of Ecitomorpha arachnoides]
FMQYFYFHYLLQYYHYSLPPYPEDTILILYQFLSVALYHFTSVANTMTRDFDATQYYAGMTPSVFFEPYNNYKFLFFLCIFSS